MIAKSFRARLYALSFLCVVAMVGFGIDRVSGPFLARAQENSLLAAIGDLALRACLGRTQMDGMNTDGHRWSIRNVVRQGVSLSVSICERRSRICVHL